jgi:hypothetical protein
MRSIAGGCQGGSEGTGSRQSRASVAYAIPAEETYMNLIELLTFVLMVGLSVWFSNFFIRHLGWMGIFPGILLGCGAVIAPLALLHRWSEKSQGTKSVPPSATDKSGDADV